MNIVRYINGLFKTLCIKSSIYFISCPLDPAAYFISTIYKCHPHPKMCCMFGSLPVFRLTFGPHLSATTGFAAVLAKRHLIWCYKYELDTY